jgi:hypothetical protein
MIEVEINMDGHFHDTEGHLEGVEEVFTCPLCPSYERRINILTGESKVVGMSAEIAHRGRSEVRAQ